MYLIRETILRYKTNILFLTFNPAKESVCSKNVSRLSKKTVSKKEKREFIVNKLKSTTINVPEKVKGTSTDI